MMDTVNGRYSLQQDQYSPHIKRVLKSFRSSAMDSLSGPREFTHFKRETNGDDDDCFRSKAATCGVPKPFTPVQLPKTVDKRTRDQVSEISETKTNSEGETREASPCPPRIPFPPPILSAPDQAWGEVSETTLEGETISCFSVGGEKRLCLPQVLNSVLRGVSISQIHGVCDELHIFCSTCSKEQLDVLKKSGILPPSASQCGLITKTDAERLCSELLNSSAPQLTDLKTDYESSDLKQRLEVHHKCFGKCRGTVRPELYNTRPARCIECHECHGLFAPSKFVSHSHDNRETRIVHWGFDSSQWRSYLLMCPRQADLERKETLFKEFKNKFDTTLKRKQSSSVEEVPDEKRSRLEEASAAALYPTALFDPAILYRYYSWPFVAATLPRLIPPPPPPTSAALQGSLQAAPAHTAPATKEPHTQTRPFLSHDPPVLLHPDRVVKTDEAKQHERHFQPNVALAPHKPAPATAPKVSCAGAECDPSATSRQLLADVEGTVAKVATLLEPLPASDQLSVVEMVRALADEVSRLRAENKQKTTLLEERTAHLRDLMVTQQKEAARQAALQVEEVTIVEKPAALDCRKLSNGGSAPTSPNSTGVTSRPSPSGTSVTTTVTNNNNNAAAVGAATARRPIGVD